MEYFNTGEILGVEERTLSANTYNIMRTLFHQSDTECVFVPIRSMQYQAIVDDKEVSFVYVHRRAQIEFVWRNFKSHERDSLDDAVNYEFIYYDMRALESMKRVQVEFHKFSQQLLERRKNAMSNSLNTDQKIAQFRTPK